MVELPGWLLVILIVGATIIAAAPTIKRGSLKVCHSVVRVITLGHKDVCRPQDTTPPQDIP